MGFFNINSVINLKYYDYIKAGTNIHSQMIYDTDVYWNGSSSIPGYSRDTKNPLNNLILVKAHSGNIDDGISDDYVQGNAYNLFFKAFTNDRMFIPSTVNTYIVEAYKETVNGREVVQYRLPMGGGVSHLNGTPLQGQNPINIPTTDPDFYDYIPVMGIIPFNVRGFLESTDHNGRKISYGEKDILVRRLTHRDISDWNETFQNYIDSNLDEWKDKGMIVYNPEGISYNIIESSTGQFNGISTDYISPFTKEFIALNGGLQVNGNLEADIFTASSGTIDYIDAYNISANGDVSIKNLNVSKTSSLEGSTYIEDLYLSQNGSYVPVTEALNIRHDIDSSITVNLGEGNSVGDAVNGMSYPAGTKIEDILKDILITRYCDWTYTPPTATLTAEFGPNYSSYADTPTISGTNIIAEYRKSPLYVVIRKTYTKNDGPTAHSSVGFNNNNDSSSRGWSPNDRVTYSVSWTEGKRSLGGNLKVDSKGTYNGLKGVTYPTSISKIGYSTKQANDYDRNEDPQDASGNILSTCDAGSLSKEYKYTAYYPTFVHVGTESSPYRARVLNGLASSPIRDTSVFTNKKNVYSYSISVPSGSKLISIVVPSSKQLRKVIYVENSNADITASFTNGDTDVITNISVGYIDSLATALPSTFKVYQYWGTWNSAATLQVTIS